MKPKYILVRELQRNKPDICWTMERSPLSIFFCLIYPPLNMKGESSNMSEAIISRRGYTAAGKPKLYTQTFTGSTDWQVPSTIRGNVSVLIFGGGGSGRQYGKGGGGGGGWMNRGEFNIQGQTTIRITIGAGGSGLTSAGQSGGTSSFGTYLSANGGTTGTQYKGGDGGSGGGAGGLGYQFGGGGGYSNGIVKGGDGGQFGGGGGGSALIGTENADEDIGRGGNGGIYGGGGGGYANGGNGGTYGGGGGGGYYKYESVVSGNKYSRQYFGGTGGSFGGRGGNGGVANSMVATAGSSGTNTSTWTNVEMINNEYIRGNGTGGRASILDGGVNTPYGGGGGGGGFGA